MRTIALTAALIVVIAAACAPVPTGGVRFTGKYQPYTVVLKPKANPPPGTLEVKSGNQGCMHGAGAKLGCVRFGVDEIGPITFALFQEDAGDRCPPAGNADWVITQVELSAAGDPATGKGVFGGTQPAWLVDAFPGTRPEDGVVYSAMKESGVATISVFDQNNHSAREGVKYAFYQVTATRCSNGQQAVIDPMVENTGRER